MKAILEIVHFNINDLVTTSTVLPTCPAQGSQVCDDD